MSVLDFEYWDVGDFEFPVVDSDLVIDFEALYLSSPKQREDGSPLKLPVQFTMWSTDYHITPIDSLKKLLATISPNYTVIDKSLSGACRSTNTCATDLKVLTGENGNDLCNCKEAFKKRFYNAYKNDAEFNRVDAFAFHHSVALSELYMAFQHGRSMFVRTTTRFEWGRYSSEEACSRLINNLRLIAQTPGAVIAANNAYDQMYMYYYTGIKPLLLPDLTLLKERYKPTSQIILIGQNEDYGTSFLVDGLRKAKAAIGGEARRLQFVPMRSLYPHYEYSQLCAHKAIIVIPYQVSIMKIMEFYWMGIPILAPSCKFFAELHLQYGVVTDLTWKHTYTRKPADGSYYMFKHPSVKENLPDPMAEHNYEAMQYWLQYSDWCYQFNNSLLFDSWEDAIHLAMTTDFSEVSRRMLIENQQRYSDTISRLSWAVRRMAGPNVQLDRTFPDSRYAAITELYGRAFFSGHNHVGYCPKKM